MLALDTERFKGDESGEIYQILIALVWKGQGKYRAKQKRRQNRREIDVTQTERAKKYPNRTDRAE
jgi:hypothetical protein